TGQSGGHRPSVPLPLVRRSRLRHRSEPRRGRWTERVRVSPSGIVTASHNTERRRTALIKLMGTAYRRDDFSPEEFIRYWNEVHAPISGKVPGLRGYVVSEVIDKLAGDLDADAFVELWWDDMESFKRASESPEQAAAWADVGNYAKTTGTFWVVREHVQIAPRFTAPGRLE